MLGLVGVEKLQEVWCTLKTVVEAAGFELATAVLAADDYPIRLPPVFHCVR